MLLVERIVTGKMNNDYRLTNEDFRSNKLSIDDTQDGRSFFSFHLHFRVLRDIFSSCLSAFVVKV